jgi:hypothetical protein
VIGPFQISDIFLLQRLGRQATRLETTQTLLQPYSPVAAALTALVPWSLVLRDMAQIMTYVLRQQGHGLASVGFMQAQKRASRPEVDITLLSPALDAAYGHPAIWQKLLAYYINEVAPAQNIARIYIVNTFTQVGFKVYTRLTIWRLAPQVDAPAFTPAQAALQETIRPQMRTDEWALQQLYARVTPQPVQQAEGMQADNAVKPPILDWWHTGARRSFVLEQQGEIQGCVALTRGRRGIWLQLWTDTQNPDTNVVQALLRFAIRSLNHDPLRLPIYLAVRDYHGGLESMLGDYGFAPFTDRARLVKPVVQWVKITASLPKAVLEPAREAVPTRFTLPALPNEQERACPKPEQLFEH